jgi:hypothetical protein
MFCSCWWMTKATLANRRNHRPPRVLQRLDAHSEVTYLRYKGLLGVAPREFVNVSHWRLDPDGTFFNVACAVEHPSCPRVASAVRGELSLGGWVLRLRSLHTPGASGYDATFVMRIDVRGSIPTFVNRTLVAQQVRLSSPLLFPVAKCTPYASYPCCRDTLLHAGKSRFILP